MRRMLAILCCCFGVARADPALWVLRGDHATIYLFGTMHMLPRGADWFSPAVRAAFDRSEVLWEEADVGIGDPSRMMSILQQGFSETDLFTLLPPAYAARLRAELARCGMPDEAVAHLKPWMAATMPGICALVAPHVAGGPAPAAGPEGTLLKAAQAQGKAVAYFETAAEQMGYLSGGTEAAQVARLKQAIDEAADGMSAQFSQMEDAWLDGDETELAAQLAAMARDDPAQYRVLDADRNRRFAARITEMARGSGTFFVAIGWGHLVGPDSVRAELAKARLVAKRQ